MKKRINHFNFYYTFNCTIFSSLFQKKKNYNQNLSELVKEIYANDGLSPVEK